MARKVFIFDTTLRDGEQSPGASLQASEKMEIAKQLAQLNVDVIEAGFPASSPQNAESVEAIATEIHGPAICALARCIEWDIVRAAASLKPAIERSKALLHVFIGVSDIHIKGQLKKTREQVLKMAVRSVRFAKLQCCNVEFSPMDATRADVVYLYDIVQAAIDAGATVINIPDTIGYAVPGEFAELIGNIQCKIPVLKPGGGVRLSVHCHDDLGLATSNTVAAVRAGATQIECAMNNMGERAGNTALEEAVMIIHERPDYFYAYTDVKRSELVNTSKLVAHLMGFPVPRNKAIVGENAGKHSSGVHQDGYLKVKNTFELFDPASVGHKKENESIVLTSQSGRHALRHRLSELGHELSDEQLERAYGRFIKVADKKKEVFDEDLEAIVQDELPIIPAIFSLEYIQVGSGTNFVPTATIGLKKGDEVILATAYGDGPVDAAFKAIDKITGVGVELSDYSLNAATKGKDAMGEALVRIKDNGRTILGRGASTDIIEASAKAYLNAINKKLHGSK